MNEFDHRILAMEIYSPLYRTALFDYKEIHKEINFENIMSCACVFSDFQQLLRSIGRP